MDENMTTTNAPEEVGEHRNLYEVFFEFWQTVFDFFKYIFYDVFLGK